MTKYLAILGAAGFALSGSISTAVAKPPGIKLQAISSVAASTPSTTTSSAAEIVAHDPITQRLYVVNARAARLDVFDILDVSNPVLIGSVEIQTLGPEFAGAVANSVAVHEGILAVAVESAPKTTPGRVAFFDNLGNYLSSVQVGAQPDMLKFTRNGRYVLTANEGEPTNYDHTTAAGAFVPANDPEGSVSIIDIGEGIANATVLTAGFTQFNAQKNELNAAGIRIFGPGATVAQDLEPEYIATSADSTTAWVTLQENNALATINIPTGTVTQIVSLGAKDHNASANAFGSSNKLDVSDRDSLTLPAGPRINIANWPVRGLYGSDAIASYEVAGQTFLVLANEGEARADWPGYTEEIRVGASGYVLDPTAFPDAAVLKAEAKLGRLNVSKASGDTDGDGDYDQIFNYGGRSFSIRNAAGALVWDSGDQFEQRLAVTYPNNFNASHTNNTLDSRSTSKGPEPEGVTIGKIGTRTYAFVSLERIGGVMTYDISNPLAPLFIDYVNNRDFTKTATMPGASTTPNPLAGDLGPEGIIFISEENSPNGQPLVVVSNEISGTTTIFQVVNNR